MILKNIDSKDEELNQIKKAISTASNVKEKSLLKANFNKLAAGYKNEKQNAFILDSYLSNSKNIIVLHDLRLEYENNFIQIDHLLISRVEITILESKSFVGKVFINSDGTLKVDNKAYPSPLEQANRQLHALKDILIKANLIKNSIGQDIIFNSAVLFSSGTLILNERLPDDYFRVDTYLKQRKEDIEKTSFLATLNLLSRMKTFDTITEMAKFIISKHKPKIIKVKDVNNIVPDNIEKQICTRCKTGHMVLRKRKNSKYNDKYDNNQFYGCSRYPKCRNTIEVINE